MPTTPHTNFATAADDRKQAQRLADSFRRSLLLRPQFIGEGTASMPEDDEPLPGDFTLHCCLRAADTLTIRRSGGRNMRIVVHCGERETDVFIDHDGARDLIAHLLKELHRP